MALEASLQTYKIQVKPARAEPHLGNIHRLTRIRPHDEEPKRARPNWSFAACKEPGRRPHSSIPALKTTIAGISGDSLPSVLPTVLSDLKQVDTAWTALQQQIDQDCG